MAAIPTIVLAGARELPQYARDGEILTQTLRDAGHAVAQTADAAVLASLADSKTRVLVLYTTLDYLGEANVKSLTDFVHRGGGLVGVHTAIATDPTSEPLGKLFGARIVRGVIEKHRIDVTDESHPIARGVQAFEMDDEWYVTEPKSEYRAFLAKGDSPMGWSREEGRGRVVYLGNGHTPAGLSHPTFREVLTRSVEYVAGML